jgi:arylsulfatase A-like enzyme
MPATTDHPSAPPWRLRDRAAAILRACRRRFAPLVLALAAFLAGAGSAGAATKPSFVLVLVDDMEAALVGRMPHLRSLVVDKGATFERAYFNVSLCCPSRATILTGRYAWNTGVQTNSHGAFHNAGNPDRTIAVWLKAAGYRTALVGKYLNGYPNPNAQAYVPPGWTTWAGRLDGGGLYYNYKLNENGRVVAYGESASSYSTDVYRGKAVNFVRTTPAGKPLFLFLSVEAPHTPNIPAPRHASLFPGATVPRPPSFNEADVSDKPAHIRRRGLFSASFISSLDQVHRKRLQMVQAVDEAVKAVVDALAETGRLKNTYVIFASDNGYLMGQHRVARDKAGPYEESVRMPLHVRGPGIPAGLRLQHLVGNVDLAPSLAEWAGVPVPADVDGRSFAPLLRSGAPGPEAWRQAYPMMLKTGNSTPAWPDWQGLRTRGYSYTEYPGTGEVELYDMARDPYQLENAAGTADPALLALLSRRTAALRGCEGAACRTLEDAPIAP